MMTLTSSRNNNGLPRLPSLPVVEHPSSRHVKGELEIHGSSSSPNENAAINKRPLPPLRNEDSRYSREKGRRHSRGATWPADLGDGRGTGPLNQKKTVDELEELIYDKLASGFYGVRQAFKSSDPQRKGNVSREAFKHILYHLCGYVSPLQFSGLLQRLGIESQSTISFDDFIRHFKDAEIVQKEWIDPIIRPTSIQANHLPANRLRIAQREAQSKKDTETSTKQGKKIIPKYYTALQVFPMVKRKANENFLEFAKLFPSSCFEEDGMVLKPQLRYALYSMSIHMYDDEYDKIWDRVDRSGMGAVDTYFFFRALGLHTRRNANEKKTPEYHVPVVIEEKPEEPQETQAIKQHQEQSPQEDQAIEIHDHQSPKAEEVKDDEQKISRAESGLSERNVKNGDVLKILNGKFRQGYESILDLFARYDTKNTGMVSRGEFRRVLSMCRLNLGPVEVEHFLSRFGVREQQIVPYREILDAFEDRTEKGLLQKILEDSKHRFNRSRESDIGNTTAIDAEAKLLDMLHADFLALLAAFKQLDRENLGLIKKYQFQEMLDARFGIKLTKVQISEMLKKIGAETPEGLVLYGRFLEEFSDHRDHAMHVDIEDRPATTNSIRPSTCPTRPLSVQSVRSHVGVDRSASFADIKKSTPAARDVDQLMAEMGHLLTDKFQVINKTFIGIDKASRNCGNLTRETFRKLFERHSLKLSPSEVDNLWKKLPIERDGTLSFIELVKTCFTAAGKTPPRDHAEYQTKGLSRALQNFARSHVRKTLENFQEEEEENQYNDIPYEAYVTSSEDKTEERHVNDVKPKEGERPKFDVIMSRIKHEVRENFNQIKDGFLAARNQDQNTVDKDVFTQILLKHCNSLTGLECEVLAQKLDRDKTGRVRYKDFLKVFLPTMPEGTDPIASPWQPKHRRTKTYPEARRVSSNEALHCIMNQIRNKLILDWKALRRAMKKSDKNGDGMITVSDFKEVMKAFGFTLNEEDFYHIFSAFDVNMDGRISYVAFMKETLM